MRERNPSEDESEENENATENSAIPEEMGTELNADGNLDKTNDKEETGNRPNAEEPTVVAMPQPEASKIINDKQGDATELSKIPSNDGKEPEPEILPAKKPKIDRAELIKKMFMKRTVDKAFEEARNRYLERKAIRQL